MRIETAIGRQQATAECAHHQLLARHRLRIGAHQLLKNAHLRTGQLEIVIVDERATRAQIDAQRPPLHRGRRRGRGAALGAAPAQHGFDARDKLTRAERLGQVIIRPHFQSHHPIDLFAARRQHDDGHALVARIRRSTSNPDSSGNMTSSTTRSGVYCASRSSAAFPLLNNSTTNPSGTKYSTNNEHSSWSSSTINNAGRAGADAESVAIMCPLLPISREAKGSLQFLCAAVLVNGTPIRASALIDNVRVRHLQEILMNMSSRAINRSRAIVIAAIAVVGLAAITVNAATSTDTTTPPTHSGHWHHHGPAAHFMHVLKQLNLSAEQQTQIKSIFASAKPQFESLRRSMRSNHEALLAATPSDADYPSCSPRRRPTRASSSIR